MFDITSFLWLILLFIIPILIVGGIIFLIVKLAINHRNNKSDNPNQKRDEKAGEEMLKNIYVYAILFVTLMMSIGGSVGVFSGLADLLTGPAHIESYSNFKDNKVRTLEIRPERYQSHSHYLKAVEELEPTIQSEYDIMVQERKDNHKNNSAHTIIMSLGWIVIPLPVFLYYQKQLKRKTE